MNCLRPHATSKVRPQRDSRSGTCACFFLSPKNPDAARHAGETIIKAVQILGLQPGLGRPIDDMPDEFREWIIDFGSSGYVARYRVAADAVVIVAIRHQKEAGF